MLIEIDENSGFCFGVKQVVKLAEETLKNGKPVYCLGEIVHNKEEVKRLEDMGMKSIPLSDLQNISNGKALIRAHGEPPSTYQTLKENNIELTEGTCPIVLQLQKKIKRAWKETKTNGGQIVIFGKKNHAETIGLNGQTENEAIIVSGIDELGAIDFNWPVSLFAQTTMNGNEFRHLASAIKEKMQKNFNSTDVPLTITNSICGHVSGRGEKLSLFAKKHDTIVFVSGHNSSNGKVLFTICIENNPNTHWVSDEHSVKEEWFTESKSVGICGATSTPQWLMKQIAEKIRQLKSE